MAETAHVDLKEFNKLMKALRGTPPKVFIGILGKSDDRHQGAGSNAEIGAKHELGLDGMPMRSFLRVPIADNLEKYLLASNLFDRASLRKVIETGQINVWIQKLGVVAEQIVQDAFQSGGFGKWKPSDMRSKRVLMTLVETSQLRNSITSMVK